MAPTRIDLITKINEIVCDHFNAPELSLNENSTAADVEGWDSVAHIQLMLRIEEELGVRFRAAEISGVKNVGELADRIAAHMK